MRFLDAKLEAESSRPLFRIRIHMAWLGEENIGMPTIQV
jgi:hypothetical protein